MKLTVFLLLLSVISVFAGKSYSQNKVLNLNMKNSTVKEVLRNIEKQSEFVFMYSDKFIDVNREVSVNVKNKKIYEVLDELFAGTDVSYKVKDRFVLLITPEVSGSDLMAQQQKSVSGKVTDSSGLPLPGVTVVVKGTTQGTVTNADGDYNLANIPEDATLVFSFVGMRTQEFLVGNQTSINVTMEVDAIGLEEVVAIGYGTMRKENVIGSVTSVREEELTAAPVSRISNALAGRLPGGIFLQESGEPGNDEPIIRIRGNSTLNENKPLIVIDGIPGRDLNSLNPQDIESVTVLKDAAAAIYGARSANGVILIITKGGLEDTPATFTYNVYEGFLTPSRLPEMVDAATYARMIREMEGYRGIEESNMQFSEDDIAKYESGEYPWTHPNTDWYGETLKDYSTTRNHDLSILGGTQKVTYRGSFGTQYDDGIYKNSATSYNRYNLKLNINAKINQYLSVMLDVAGIQENRMSSGDSEKKTWMHLMKEFPHIAAIWPNGLPGPMAHGSHPIVSPTFESGFNDDKIYRSNNLLSATLKIPWVEGLSLTGYYSHDLYMQKIKLFSKPITAYSLNEDAYLNAGNTGKEDGSEFLIPGEYFVQEPQLTNYFNHSQTNTANIKLDYENTLNEVHNIQAFIAYEHNEFKEGGFDAFRRYFISDQLPYLFAGGDSEKDNSEFVRIDAQMNYFGRLSYNYDKTFYFQFSLRRDGSLRFSKENRFGNFPSILLGYRPSELDWWKSSLGGFIDDLKLRVSWGQMGNDQISPFQYFTSYGFTQGYTLGEGKIYAASLDQANVPNPNITWEVSNMYNLGWDAYLFNSKLSFITDFFYERRTNILIKRNVSIPIFTGMSLPDENFGIVENKGLELLLAYREQIGRFRHTLSGNFAFSRNKVIEFDEPESPVPWQLRTGKPMNALLLYRHIGVFSDWDEVNSLPHVSGARPGDIIIEDYDDDGEITTDDRQLFPLTLVPEITFGLSYDISYKSWQLSALIQGQARTMAPRFLGNETAGSGGGYLQYFADDRWTPDNTDATKPRAFERDEEYWRSDFITDFNYSDNSFIRLKNLQLSYTVPHDLMNKIRIKNAKIFIAGQNLFLIYSANEISDPETSNTRNYPLMKVLSVGAQLTFF